MTKTINGKTIRVALQPTKYKNLDSEKQKLYDVINRKIDYITNNEAEFVEYMDPIDELVDSFKKDLYEYKEMKKALERAFVLGQTFYYYDGKSNRIKKDVVKSLVQEPDGSIMINWSYQFKNCFKSKESCLNAAIQQLNESFNCMIEELQKGDVENGNKSA